MHNLVSTFKIFGITHSARPCTSLLQRSNEYVPDYLARAGLPPENVNATFVNLHEKGMIIGLRSDDNEEIGKDSSIVSLASQCGLVSKIRCTATAGGIPTGPLGRFRRSPGAPPGYPKFIPSPVGGWQTLRTFSLASWASVDYGTGMPQTL